MTVLQLSRLILRFAVSLILAIAVLWAGAALSIDGPASPVLAATLAGGLVLVAGLAAVLVRPWWRAVPAVSIEPCKEKGEEYSAVMGFSANTSPTMSLPTSATSLGCGRITLAKRVTCDLTARSL